MIVGGQAGSARSTIVDYHGPFDQGFRFVHEGKCCSRMKTSRWHVSYLKHQIHRTSVMAYFEKLSLNILYWVRNPPKRNHPLTVFIQGYLFNLVFFYLGKLVIQVQFLVGGIFVHCKEGKIYIASIIYIQCC